MISRNEFLYTKIKLDKIKDMIWDNEMKSDIYKKWEKYKSLSESEKAALKEKWDAYYQKCAESPYGILFFGLRKDFMTGTGIKLLIEQKIKEIEDLNIPAVPQPSSMDPEILEIKMGSHFKLLAKKRELETIYEEYKGVYEAKKEVEAL